MLILARGLKTISALMILVALSANAQADLIMNGNFASYTTGANGQGQLGDYTTLTNWASGSSTSDTYSTHFLYTPNTADTAGSYNPENNNYYKLWGPNDGSTNGLTGASPTGSNYVSLDGDSSYRGTLSQTINGLTTGRSYYLNFNWAGAQQYGYTGAAYDSLGVTLGSQTLTTATVMNASQGFTGWFHSTMVFTATGTSEVLSFLSSSTPTGVPPYVLLSDISLNVVPEPSSVVLVLSGVVFALGARFRRRVGGASKA